MEHGGVGLTTLNAIVAELAKDWSTHDGKIAHAILQPA